MQYTVHVQTEAATVRDCNINNQSYVDNYVSLPKHQQVGAFGLTVPLSSNIEECANKFIFGNHGILAYQSY